MDIVIHTLATLASALDVIKDPSNKRLAMVQTYEALGQLIKASEPAAPKAKRQAKVKHQTLVEPAPATKPFTAVVRNGLIVVTWVSKEAYLANKQVLGEKVFGFSPVSKEWRASEAWVRKNQPQILAGLGLK